MCAPWPDFEEYIIERAKRRRQRDDELIKMRRPEDRGRNIHKRPTSDLCYAIDIQEEEDFVGYSADAGLITSSRVQDYCLVDRWNSRNRLESFELGSGVKDGRANGPANRPFCNCAEARAMALAKDANVPIERLFFASFYPIRGKGADMRGSTRLKSPCPNCQSWLKLSAGYCREGMGPICFRGGRRDDDKGGGGGHGPQKTPLIVPGALSLVK